MNERCVFLCVCLTKMSVCLSVRHIRDGVVPFLFSSRRPFLPLSSWKRQPQVGRTDASLVHEVKARLIETCDLIHSLSACVLEAAQYKVTGNYNIKYPITDVVFTCVELVFGSQRCGEWGEVWSYKYKNIKMSSAAEVLTFLYIVSSSMHPRW